MLHAKKDTAMILNEKCNSGREISNGKL